MKVLITGSNGFIGRNVVRYFKEIGDETVGIGRSGSNSGGADTYIQADIAKRSELFENAQKMVSGVDVIVHAAAEISEDVERLYAVNCCGTQNIVDLAAMMNCRRFIYISSLPIIGKPEVLPITEEHPVRPATVYHYTKYFGEQITAQLAGSNTGYVCLRIASPVGSGMPDDKIFSVFVRNSMRNEALRIFGDGKRMQNYIDTRDLSEAIAKAAASDACGVYNIPGRSMSDIVLAQCCITTLNSSSRIEVGKSNAEPERWMISGEAAKRDFGYESAIKIEDSVRYVAEGLAPASKE